MSHRLLAWSLLASTVAAAPARAGERTEVDVRVISKGAKFIGESLGGVEVTIRDAGTGELLAHGVTAGSTGDTDRIMKTALKRDEALSTPGTAVFRASLDLEEPRQVEVRVRGPLGQAQALNTASVTQWLVPGKHVTGGDAFLLELPGFAVDVLAPPAHVRLPGPGHRVELKANVVMMCGCPVEPGGLWDASRFEVTALLRRGGKLLSRHSLEYAGSTSQFAASLAIQEPGTYEAIVYAYDPANGNTGLDRTTFVVTPPPAAK